MLVIYDKEIESEGALKCVRFESRFFGDRAKALWVHLLPVDALGDMGVVQDVAGLTRALGAAVGGSVTFQTRHGSVMPFWRELRRLLRRSSSL